MGQIHDFFNQNSTYREHFLKHKLFFDVQWEFAKQNQRILIYEPEYDQDGFDLIFDNLSYQRHIQVKSILIPATTSHWMIHRNLLRPHILELNNYPASPDSYGVGYGGGVLLIYGKIISEEKSKQPIISTSYYFTDALIISALSLGIIEYKDYRLDKAAKDCAKRLFDFHEIGGKIQVPKSCFWNFYDLAELFSYCGFCLKDKFGLNIRTLLNKALLRFSGKADKIDQRIPYESWKKIIYNDLSKIMDTSMFFDPHNLSSDSGDRRISKNRGDSYDR